MKIIIVLTFFISLSYAQVRKSELTQISSENLSTTLKSGDRVWINGLCKKVLPNGDLEVIPLAEAKSGSCPARRDYTEIDSAYKKLDVVPFCKDIARKDPSIELTCSTTTGNKFQRYQNTSTMKKGWKDLSSDGKIWYDDIDYFGVFKSAQAFCANRIGQRLPTSKEVEIADKRGLREAMFNISGLWQRGGPGQGDWIWTSSAHQVDDARGITGWQFSRSIGHATAICVDSKK